jgi:hypothetical protein
MKKIPIAALLLLNLFAFNTSSAEAKFTGIMQMTMALPNGAADATYYFGSTAQRMDMVMKVNKIPDPLKTTVITKASSPDLAIIVNYQARTWTSVNLRTAAENATLLDFDSNYRLARIGRETLRGYSCEHINLRSTTENIDMWVSRDLGNFSTFSILQAQNPRLSNSALARTLKNAGIEGFPVKIVQKNTGGTSTMELSRISEKAVAASLFEVPEGFRKAADTQKPLDKTEKEHLKSIMEKMKNFER